MKNKVLRNIHLHFLSEYVHNHREIGTVGPDSSACVDGLLRSVPFPSAGLIVEFGAASGTVTREIVRRRCNESTLICFEKNRSFYTRLRRTLDAPNVFFVQDDAFNAVGVLAGRFGIRGRSVDCIVSTLPCSSMPFEELLHTAVLPLLKDDGVFIQYMHTISVFKGYRLRPVLRRYFRRISSHIVFRNFPPALIYACRRALPDKPGQNVYYGIPG